MIGLNRNPRGSVKGVCNTPLHLIHGMRGYRILFVPQHKDLPRGALCYQISEGVSQIFRLFCAVWNVEFIFFCLKSKCCDKKILWYRACLT